MFPSPNEISYFVELSKCLNMCRAAERLGITQPTLSQAIKRLEKNVGETLLIRSKSGVQLTKFGSRFLQGSQNILHEWEKLRATTLCENNEVKGQYTIGCHPSVGIYTLKYFLPELLSSYPKLEINLVHDISRRITEEVISYKIDFGIVVNPVSHPDLVISQLATDAVTFWTAHDNPNQDTLICDQNLLQIQSLIKGIKKKKWNFNRIIHCTNLEVITDLVAAGAGVGILPTRVASQNILQNLVHFEDNGPVFQDEIALIYRHDANRGLSSKKIIDSIKAVNL